MACSPSAFLRFQRVCIARIGLVAGGAEGQSANWRPLAYGMGPNGLDLPWACGDHDAIQAPQAPIDLAPSGGK